MELICKHCQRRATFASREAVTADGQWSIVLLKGEANGRAVLHEAAFCPATPPDQVQRFIEGAFADVASIERRVVE